MLHIHTNTDDAMNQAINLGAIFTPLFLVISLIPALQIISLSLSCIVGSAATSALVAKKWKEWKVSDKLRRVKKIFSK